MLELLVVAAIVAVISAFAIPGYNSYIRQARVNALWSQAEEAKLAVEAKYIRDNQSISSITVNSGTKEYTTPTLDFVKCITIQNGVVSVVGVPAKFNNLSIWISWQPTTSTGSVDWGCVYSSDTAQYVTDVASTCAAQTCQTFGAWNTATTVNTQTMYYFGSLTQSQVSSAFVNNCNTSGTMTGCASCYNFTNTNSTQRYMTYTLTPTTYNYQGGLGGNPTWNSFSSWAYQYTYTVVTQNCMQQTRTVNTCGNTNPFTADSACN